jgi:hypothetical protein
MPFSIDEFSSNLNLGGVAKPSNFQVMVTKPTGSDVGLSNFITYRSDSITFPTRQIVSENIFTYGIPYPVALRSLPGGDLFMSIILSEDYTEKEFIETWIDSITGKYRTQYQNGTMSSTMYDIQFPSSYYGQLEIVNFDTNGNATYGTKVLNAFPYQMQITDLDWSSEQISRMNVLFHFETYFNVKQGY